MLQFVADQFEVTEIFLRRFLAWTLLSLTVVAVLCTSLTVVSPLGKIRVLPSVHELLLSAAMCVALLGLAGTLFADLSVFCAPRGVVRALSRRVRLLLSAAFLGCALGLITHRLLEVRWAQTYGQSGGIMHNVLASLRMLTLTFSAGVAAHADPNHNPNPHSAEGSLPVAAVQRWANELARRTHSASSFSSSSAPHAFPHGSQSPDEYYRSPLGMVLCCLCGSLSLVALLGHYEKAGMRCTTLVWEPEVALDQAFEVVQVRA